MPHKKKRFRLTKGSEAASKSLSPRRTDAIAKRAGSVIRDHPFKETPTQARERRKKKRRERGL